MHAGDLPRDFEAWMRHMEAQVRILDERIRKVGGDAVAGAGATDHGALTGLGDDDHPQYLNNARGDARYDLAGAAAAAQAASQPADSDLTAIAALTTTAYGRGLLALADAAAARAALVLGTAATHNHGDYDAAGAAAAAQAAAIAASQPVDADLTAIAALATTTYGRAFLALADAAAARTALSLGSAATQSSAAFDAAGAAAAAQAASQPLDSDLTAIAALTTTTFGRALLTMADSGATRTALGLIAYTVPAGRWWTPHSHLLQTNTPTAGTLYASPILLPCSMKLDTVRIEVTAAIATGLYRLGFYAQGTDGLPDLSTCIDLGTVDTSTTGLKDWTPAGAYTLTPGVWYVAGVCQTAAATIRMVGGNLLPMPLPAGLDPIANAPTASLTRTGITGALPTTGSFSNVATVPPPKLYIKQSA